MGIEALSDINKGGFSAFGGDGGSVDGQNFTGWAWLTSTTTLDFSHFGMWIFTSGGNPITFPLAAGAAGKTITITAASNTQLLAQGANGFWPESVVYIKSGETIVFVSNGVNGWYRCDRNDNEFMAAAVSSGGVLDLQNVTGTSVAVTLTENISSILLPPPTVGRNRALTIWFWQDGVGGRTVAGWPAGTTYRWESNLAIDTRANQPSVISLNSFNGSAWGVDGGHRSGGAPSFKLPATQRIVAGAISNTVLGTAALTAARIYFIPYVPSRRIRVTALGVSVSTLLAGTATLGIYAADGNASFDYPGTLLAACAAGAIDTSTTGTKTASVACVLDPGKKYFLALIGSAAATLRTVAIAAQLNTLGFQDNAANSVAYYYNNGSGNVLPGTAAAPIVGANSVHPAIYIVE